MAHNSVTKVTVDKEALWNVIAYLWADEKDDAMAALEDNRPGEHIFSSLRRLARDSEAPVSEWTR